MKRKPVTVRAGVALEVYARTPRQAVVKLLALEARVWRELDHDWSNLDD